MKKKTYFYFSKCVHVLSLFSFSAKCQNGEKTPVFAWKFILLAFLMSAKSHTVKARGMVLINHFEGIISIMYAC
jgi:hypothetical protein